MKLEPRARRRIVWGIGALLLVLLLALAFRPTPVAVETATVTRGPMEVTIDADGVTRVVDRYQIAAPVTGMLLRLQAREGDAVRDGQVLARIEPVPLDPAAETRARSAVAVAEARLAEASERAIQAETIADQLARAAQRTRLLAEEGAVSVEARERADVEAENAARELAAAGTRVTAARGDVAAARAALGDLDDGGDAADVVAPADGRVLRIHQRSDRVIPAGTPLLDVGDARALEVVVDVLSTDAVRISEGMPLRIENWGGDVALAGQVRHVEPSAFTRVSTLGVEEQRVNVIGEVSEVPPALGDGFRVEARIVIWSADDVQRVPSTALFREGDGWRVFIVDGDRARRRDVRIGQRAVVNTEVLDGLSEGERVVLFPPDDLEDGDRVSVR